MPHEQEFVTIKQASERLGVSPRTIRRWVADIGTSDITRGTAKRHTLEVDISALEQWTDGTQRTQISQKPHKNKEKQKNPVAQAPGASRLESRNWWYNIFITQNLS